MFGKYLDYLVLRPIAHKRNIATEEELDRRADQVSLQSVEKGVFRLQERIRRFQGLFPINPDLRYLDMGCGTGEMTIALAKLGCKNVTGVDIVPRNIAACEFHSKQFGLGNRIQFICRDLNNWIPPEKFDVLLSFDAFEHIDNPASFLRKMADFVSPRGVAVLSFGPLFHSPFGDHQWDFYRLQIPWRGILFSEKALLKIRRECFRPTDRAECFKDVVEGMNRMRYSEFLRYVQEAGWQFSFLSVNPFLKRLPPLYYASNAIARMPIIKDYFVHSIYAILRRAS
ncbi:MAG: class I SAM-dependent methyltransferase [Thermoguttaceae bacterium]|jgi:SAM-dependent methyltransferase